VATVGGQAGIGNICTHTLGHSCGFDLANKGYEFRVMQDYLEQRVQSIQHNIPGWPVGGLKNSGIDS
tara:strand:- start:303 stop:503 length:201 start_codon:yes stop_codon:yes gene_type:complete